MTPVPSQWRPISATPRCAPAASSPPAMGLCAGECPCLCSQEQGARQLQATQPWRHLAGSCCRGRDGDVDLSGGLPQPATVPSSPCPVLAPLGAAGTNGACIQCTGGGSLGQPGRAGALGQGPIGLGRQGRGGAQGRASRGWEQSLGAEPGPGLGWWVSAANGSLLSQGRGWPRPPVRSAARPRPPSCRAGLLPLAQRLSQPRAGALLRRLRSL